MVSLLLGGGSLLPSHVRLPAHNRIPSTASRASSCPIPLQDFPFSPGHPRVCCAGSLWQEIFGWLLHPGEHSAPPWLGASPFQPSGAPGPSGTLPIPVGIRVELLGITSPVTFTTIHCPSCSRSTHWEWGKIRGGREKLLAVKPGGSVGHFPCSPAPVAWQERLGAGLCHLIATAADGEHATACPQPRSDWTCLSLDLHSGLLR